MTEKPSLDLYDRLIEFLATHVDLPAGIEMGRSDVSGPSFALILTPTDETKRYFNGRVRRAFKFELYSKLEKWRDSTGLLTTMLMALEGAGPATIKSGNNSFSFVKAEMINTPAYKSALEDNGVTYSVYSAAVKCTVVIN